ncbi:hypothetical protein NXS19_006396 [Fusarium pseudograminearum]|nr:hypothetical protein NXS19_006396 [Fusarium pseudograminearum]
MVEVVPFALFIGAIRNLDWHVRRRLQLFVQLVRHRHDIFCKEPALCMMLQGNQLRSLRAALTLSHSRLQYLRNGQVEGKRCGIYYRSYHNSQICRGVLAYRP